MILILVPLTGEEGIGLYFDADKELCELCEKTLKEMDVCVHCGLVASGDQFIAGENQLTVLEKRFPDAVCEKWKLEQLHRYVRIIMYHSLFFVLCRILHIKKIHIWILQPYVKHAANRSAEFCKKFIEQL